MEGAISYSEFQRLRLDGPYGLDTEEMVVDSNPTSTVDIPSLPQDYYPTPKSSPSRSIGHLSQFSGMSEHPLQVDSDGIKSLEVESIAKELEMSGHPSCTNTYFFDERRSFISLPSLGSSSTKGASQVSRVFEEWLESKIYYHSAPDTIPILQEKVSQSAHDIMRKIRSRSHRALNGLSRILIKIRAGHVYNYHEGSLSGNDLCLDDDVAEFFQQFPLFVKVFIVVAPSQSCHLSSPTTEVVLSIENAGVNPCDPFLLREVFSCSEDGRGSSGRSPIFSPMSL